MSIFPESIQMDSILPSAPTSLFAAPTTTSSSWKTYLYGFLGLVVVGGLIYGVYWYATNKASGSWNPVLARLTTTSTPYPGKTKSVISGAAIPAGVQDYGVQFWMFIKDWDYRFGEDKVVLQRIDPSMKGAFGPQVSLSPNDNTLNVKISLFPSDPNSVQKSTPAPANQGGSATGDSFTCKVENVPLQAWFSVSVTVFQRNVDIYINGKLVKSCVLPGVPRPIAGDIEVGPGGGFSGSVCDVMSYAKMLVPNDATAFYTAGTPCSSIQDDSDSGLTGNLFGYTTKFGIFDKTGKKVKEFVY